MPTLVTPQRWRFALSTFSPLLENSLAISVPWFSIQRRDLGGLGAGSRRRIQQHAIVPGIRSLAKSAVTGAAWSSPPECEKATQVLGSVTAKGTLASSPE